MKIYPIALAIVYSFIEALDKRDYFATDKKLATLV
ncbi:4a87feef-4399-46e8-aecc-db6d293d564f [Thermothielavioides terrestris]|uniref:4a87feef-4399-46e8-aecc-db6d293d564f n=1 Tax=Thermothielavioides terrestris TaxID=2587410 RepID=A0A446BWW5_9PEZI|nr:4a87feef-4399-46e8-aecc-db6d293d564f [Thermothielavioides terrestris]